MTTTKKMYFASEMRYLGVGTIESTNLDGSLIVNIDGMGRGKIAQDMAFTTKREALLFATVPQRSEWSDVAKLSAVR